MEEELVTQPTEEVKTEEVAPVDQVANNTDAIIKQQQAQIEQLIKQQELTNRINQQLTKKVAQMSENQQVKSNPEEHWVDKVLRENFDYRVRYDLKTEQDRFLKDANSTKQLASWWLQYNKSKGLSNDEIATKYKKMAEVMQGAVHSEDI